MECIAGADSLHNSWLCDLWGRIWFPGQKRLTSNLGFVRHFVGNLLRHCFNGWLSVSSRGWVTKWKRNVGLLALLRATSSFGRSRVIPSELFFCDAELNSIVFWNSGSASLCVAAPEDGCVGAIGPRRQSLSSRDGLRG